MKKILITLLCLAAAAAAVTAQTIPTIDRGLVEIDNLTERAMAAIDEDNYDAALELIRLQIKRTPKDPDPRCILGAIMAFTDKPKQGVVVMDAALKLFEPEDMIGKAKALIYRGVMRESSGDTIGAINDFSEAMAIDPVPYLSDFKESRNVKWHPFFNYLTPEASAADMEVNSLLGSGRTKEALALQQQLIAGENDKTRLPKRYARCIDISIEDGDMDLTLGALKLGLLASTDFDDYYEVLTSIPDTLAEASLPVFEETMKEKPDDWILTVCYGALLINADQQAKLLSMLDKIIKKFPDHEDTFMDMRIKAYVKAKEYDNALREIDNLIGKFPDATDVMLKTKVDVLKKAGYNEALSKAYDEIIERTEGNEDAEYENISAKYENAILMRRMGKPEESIKYYDGLLENNEIATPILCNKADALMECGKTEEAKEIYERILEIDPDSISESFRPFALQSLGRAYEAIAFLKKKIEAEPTYSDYYYLACIYSRIGDAAKAVETLRETAELFPDDISAAALNEDIDFDPVRKDPAFVNFMSSLTGE